MFTKISLCAFPSVVVLIAVASSAFCEVRFDKNVIIGGRDFSRQTFDRKRCAEAHLYDSQPKNAGRHWRMEASGGRVKVCRLQNLH